MNLSELLAKGTVESNPPKKVSVVWVDKEDGDKEYEFEVFIRVCISFAASERIFHRPITEDEDSYNSRIISELVRFGDGTERMTVKEAACLKQTLGNALTNAVHNEFGIRGRVADAGKKKLVQRKKSGTN